MMREREIGRQEERKEEKKRKKEKSAEKTSQFQPHSVSTAYFTSAKAVRGFATGTN